MTIKQKFSSIDQSKLTADQKAFLTKIKDVTKNFTDAEMNKKVEAPLDGFIAKAKEKMPEAVKSAPVKRTSKAKSSQTRKPKRTAMSLAKEIRKEGESWNEARARASKMMKEDSKDLSKTVESELDKLSKLVKSQKERQKLSGLSGTNIKRDASRKAKPKGRRISKDGNVYYENRDNRTDRLAPNYPKNSPFLAEGGYLTDPTFGNFQNQVFAGGGAVTNERRYVNKDEDYEVRYSKPILRRKGYQGKRDFATGGGVGDFDVKLLVGKRVVYEVKVDTLKKAQRIGSEILSWEDDGFEYTIIGYDSSNNKIFENKRLLSDEFPAKLKDKFATLQLNVIVANPKQNKLNAGSFTTYRALLNIVDDFEEANFRVTINGKTFYEDDYELGGVMATDLAGHTGGGDAGFNAGSPLSGFSNTAYTGLVGETGAMSSGEMFMNGGQVEFVKDFSKKDGIQISEDKAENGKTFYSAVINSYPLHKMIPMNEDKNYVIKRAEKIYSNMLEYKKNEKYELGGGLPSGSEQSYMITESFGNPAQHYARGGGVRKVGNREYSYGRNWTNDHRHINKGENHEVKYTRKGKFMGVFDDGGMMNDGNYAVFSNKRNVIIADGFKTKEEAEKFIYDYALTYPDITLSIKKYNKGGSVTNERRYVNKDEDYEVRYSKPILRRKGYKGARKFMAGGMNNETPRIYVADLEAYNNGRLVGEWLDLSDYDNADELMDAIQDVLKKSGGEEYAIHDYENFPSILYSEYMSRNDFQALYDVMETAKRNDLPLEVVQDIVSQYGEGGVEEFYGKFDNAEDFAYQQVEEIGLDNFSSPEYYVYITDTDRRLLAGEMADSYVNDIRDEDGGNRVIEEAGMDVLEYQEADTETQEEMLDKAVEIVRDEYYDNWYDGLSDPYYFLVDEQGMYSPDDFFKASFISVDYEKLGRDLKQDYTFIEYDGDLYVFNIR
jgi:antirestriction protein